MTRSVGRSRGTHHARPTASTALRLLAPLLLTLGILGLSVSSSVRAEPTTEEPPPKAEKGEPSRPTVINSALGLLLERALLAPQTPPPPPTPIGGPGQPGFGPQPGGFADKGSPPQRFQFTIDPKTPLKDLLPTPPKVQKPAALPGEDLSRVPEIELQAAPTKQVESAEAIKQTAHLIARINHLNGKKSDGFIEALLGERADLKGLPFAMGDACRTKGERSRRFALAVALVRQTLQSQQQQVQQTITRDNGQTVTTVKFLGDRNPEAFWDQYQAACVQEDKTLSRVDKECLEHVLTARVAALMQVLAPESPGMRLGLVKYLSSVPQVEATRALARLALFSSEDEVRLAAVDALKVRRERDYTGMLLGGMRYPLPAVARRASDALVKLERTDLIPQLVDLLDEPDPRAPVVKEVEGKKVPVVKELVRINHHKNCLMCHAPGNTGAVSPETLTAPVPSPSDPLPEPSSGYGNGPSPDVLVRIDVTYLRQDFSLMQAVADANPWPEMQRFDFLVRSRQLTEEEAKVYREQFDKREPNRPSAYRRAVLKALRELTGQDAEPSAEAWRKLLKGTPQKRAAVP